MGQRDSNLKDAEFIAFDLETTGLHPVASEIVEIGAVRFRGDGTVLGQFDQLVKPPSEIPAGVVAIHGITNAMVAKQPPVAEVLPQLVKFIGDTSAVLLAHNAGFDVRFLSVAFSRSGHRMPDHTVIDTCVFARRRLQLPNYRLKTIGQHLRLNTEEEHRALADTRLLKDVFCHLLRKSPAIQTMKSLLDITTPFSFSGLASIVTDPPEGYEDLWIAIASEQPVEMEYVGGSNPGDLRIVTPRSVMQMRGHTYLSAYCHQSECDKTYRLDRITAYRRTT